MNYRHSETLSFYVLCTNLFDRKYDKEYNSGMSGTYYDPRPGRFMEVGSLDNLLDYFHSLLWADLGDGIPSQPVAVKMN